MKANTQILYSTTGCNCILYKSNARNRQYYIGYWLIEF